MQWLSPFASSQFIRGTDVCLIAWELAVSSIAQVSSFLKDVLLVTEVSAVAVSRIQEIINIKPEAIGTLEPAVKTRSSWISEGTLEFRNVSMRYGESLPLALADMTFKVKAGTRVGVVGRSGSGKTSLLNGESLCVMRARCHLGLTSFLEQLSSV